MKAESTSQKFRLKNMEEIKKYSIKEIDQNELISKKHKKVLVILNYSEHFLILVYTVTCKNFPSN